MKVETFKCATGSGWAIMVDDLMDCDIPYSPTEDAAARKARKAYPGQFVLTTASPSHFSNAQDLDAFAEKLSDAYSWDRYRGGWRACIRLLRLRKLTDPQIEAIIRSKWTRWAADASCNPYGKVTARDLMAFVDRQPADAIDRLAREHWAGTLPEYSGGSRP